MRPIKFRGRGIDGVTYYGDLYHARREVGIHVIGSGTFEVDPDSVAQLVGYDKNGKEVYEGDTLIDDDGAEFIASLQGVVRWETDDMPDHLKTVPFDFAQKFTPLTLKERTL